MVVTPRRVPTLLLLAVKGVVGVCAEPQVRRGATAWVIARMTDEVVAGVGACGEEICEVEILTKNLSLSDSESRGMIFEGLAIVVLWLDLGGRDFGESRPLHSTGNPRRVKEHPACGRSLVC